MVRAGALLGAAALAAAAGWAGAQPEAPERSVTLSADEMEFVSGDRARAEGEVRLESGGFLLQADAAEADLATGDVTASGRITLRQEARTLSGEALVYNYNSKVGRFERAQARAGRATIRGEEILLEPGRYTARDGSFTTCAGEPPLFRIGAREITIYPGDRAVVRKASFWVKGKRLFTLPEHTFSLRREQAATGLFPRVGFSRADGGFAGPVYGCAPSKDVIGYAEVRMTTHRGVRVMSHLTALRPWGSLAAKVTVREDQGESVRTPEEADSGQADVTLDRLPELAAHLEPMRLTRGLTLAGDALLGHYRESPTGAEESRADLRARLQGRLLRVGGRAGLRQAVSLRPIWYADGQHRFVWSSTTTLEIEASPTVDLALGYFENHVSGSTPFRFDEIEITRGFQANVDADLSQRWATRLAGRYDLRQKTFRETDITLIYRGDCLDYSVRWSKLRGAVALGVAFPADAFGP